MTETATARPGAPGGAGDANDGGMRATAHDAGDRAREVAGTAKEEAGAVIGEARSQTRHLVDEAGQRARGRVDEQMSTAARAIGEMSDELDRMAGAASGDGAVVTLARDGATAMRSLSRRLDEGGLEAAMYDVRRFARRRPLVFLGGAFAVGLLAGRLARNADLHAVADQARDGAGSSDPAPELRTGTESRLESGMEPGLLP